MKKIKQLTFDITQSRRIKNYAQKLKIKEEVLLKKFRHTMHIIYHAWEKSCRETEEVSFHSFFRTVMKYAEFAFRLKARYTELETINRHVVILREALVEYEQDYDSIIRIEKLVDQLEGGL
jgi:tRNA G10  N-methylase Trm11